MGASLGPKLHAIVAMTALNSMNKECKLMRAAPLTMRAQAVVGSFPE